MKYLCTGGAGHIGSHLVDRLLKDDNVERVAIVDDLSSGRLENLPQDPRIVFYRSSIADDNIEYAFKGIDTVFHLAALTRPQWSILYPIHANHVNVYGTLRVLVYCRDNGIKRVVFASSASMYGEQETYPISESAIPKPMSPYGLQKQVGEHYCELFGRIYGLPCNCMRFFNVYGARMDPNGWYSAVIPKFIKMIREGKQPTIFGDGKQDRDFVYIDDVVNALLLAAKSDVTGQAFNVGSGTSISVNDLTDMLLRKLGSDLVPVHQPPVIEPRTTLADICKIRNALGWTPTVRLEDGLDRIIDAY